MKVLIVDDDSMVRHLWRKFLRTIPGCEPVEAANGMEALEIFHGEDVDLIISDREMPVLDGLGLLQAVKERMAHTPVVMLSGYWPPEAEKSARALGAYAVLPKNTPIGDLIATIREALMAGLPA